MKKLLVFLVTLSVLIGMLNVVVALNTATKITDTGDGAFATTSGHWSTSAPNSAYLKADEITNRTNEGRVRIEFRNGMTLNDLDNISWEQNIITGYASHVDVLIDIDEDNISDDALVFEYAKVNPNECDDSENYPTGEINTFGNKGIVDLDAYAWLNSGPAGHCGDPNFDKNHSSLTEWKTTHGTAKVTAIEIEVDGWIEESEAYIDDIMINGELVEDFETNQDVDGTVEDFISFTVSPETLNFGNIPYGIDITKSGSDVTIDTSGSDTVEDNVKVEVEVSQDTDTDFFEDLIEYDIDGTGTWEGFASSIELIVPSADSKVFHTRIKGNTAAHGAGQKQGVLTYTATSMPPE